MRVNESPEETTEVAAPPQRRPDRPARFRIHNLDFRLPDGATSTGYSPSDPSRISIRFFGPAIILNLTVDEGLAQQLRDELDKALPALRSARRGAGQ
jgi:hypothetical protein